MRARYQGLTDEGAPEDEKIGGNGPDDGASEDDGGDNKARTKWFRDDETYCIGTPTLMHQSLEVER